MFDVLPATARRALIGLLVSVASGAAVASEFQGPIIQRVEPSSSVPLSELAVVEEGSGSSLIGESEARVPPARWMHRIGWGAGQGPVDPLLDEAFRGGVTAPPEIGWDAIGNPAACAGCTPPDPMIAVGPDHVVHVVNATKVTVYNKTGTLLTGPSDLGNLWPGGTICSNNAGDPVVTYDWLADRFVIGQFASPRQLCIAVSQTANPTGAYHVYQFDTPSFPDYFKLAAWGNAYYVGANEDTYTAAALNRSAMLAGSPATIIHFTGGDNFLMPANLSGRTAPPANAPGIFYTFKDNSFHGGVDRLEFWHFAPNFTTPANSAFTLVQSVPLAGFTYTVCGFFNFNCVAQPGTAQRIDAVSEWPMWQLQYRHFGGGDERLAASFTVDGGSDVAAVRWFEVRKSANTYALRQQGTAGAASEHRFVPSTAMDRCGNLALGYSVSSATIAPSLRFATRLAGDPLGTLRAEAVLHAGGGSQTGGSRWGDYSAVVLDPADECAFYMTGEYYAANFSSTWRTRIGRFRAPECSSTCGPPAALSIADVSVTEGNAGPVSATFTITRSNTLGPVSVQVATSNGTATAGSDYTAVSGQTVQFTAGGAATATVTVPVIGDVTDEADETFNVTLSSPTNATLADATAVGTIMDDDGPRIAINNASVTEADSGTVSATFTVTLTGSMPGGFTVAFATTDGTATQPVDYAPANGILSFAGTDGETRSVTVQVASDDVVEPLETFLVLLATPSNPQVSVSDGIGTGSIQNDDTAVVSVFDRTQAEGNAGTANFPFAVTLVGAVQGGVSVPFTTAAGTATTPADFNAVSGTVNFSGSNGEIEAITVPVIGDLVPELDESFTVTLATPSVSGVTLADGSATGTITNDDLFADVTVSVSDGATTSPEGGQTTYTVVVANTSAVVDLAAVSITQSVSANLVGLTWSCTGSGGATCPASGSGALAETRALPRGSALTYQVTANVAAGGGATTVTTVTATVQSPASDPDPANNSATDTNAVLPSAIFSNGFE